MRVDFMWLDRQRPFNLMMDAEIIVSNFFLFMLLKFIVSLSDIFWSIPLLLIKE